MNWRPRTLLVWSTILWVVFALVSLAVVEWGRPGVDRWLLRHIHAVAGAGTESVAAATTNVSVMVVLLPALAVVLAIARPGRRVAMASVLSIVGTNFLVSYTKSTFDLPRPSLWRGPIIEHTPSLPSGHSALAVSMCIVLLAIFGVSGWRVALAMVFTTWIGFTRLCLGVHYPTDVLDGYLLGSACTLLSFWAVLAACRPGAAHVP